MKNLNEDKMLSLLCDKYGFVKEYLNVLGVPSLYTDDILQETFLAAYAHLGQLKKTESMEAWLCRIAFHNMLRYRKKRKSVLEKEKHVTSCITENSFAANAKSDEFIIRSLNYSISSSELYEMVKKLKYPASRIILLRFEMGFKLSEIAPELNMNYNTVKTIERRAIMKLKVMIEEKCRLEAQ